MCDLRALVYRRVKRPRRLLAEAASVDANRCGACVSTGRVRCRRDRDRTNSNGHIPSGNHALFVRHGNLR